MNHVIRVVRVWPVNVDYLPWIVWAVSLLFFLLASLCAMKLINLWRQR